MRRVDTTSLQRTYRYLRVGIAGCAVLIVVAVVVASIQLGTVPPSISAYAYSPARVVVTGALIAVSLALLALSGRGLERAILDAAALFAPLVALVPTRVTPGTIPSLDLTCPGGADSCVPPAEVPGVENGVLTYLVVGVIAVLTAVAIARAQGTLRASGPSLLVAVGVLVTVAAIWFAARDAFVDGGHLAATGVFFGLIALASIRGIRPFPGEAPRGRAVRWAFAVIGAAIGLDVLVLVVVAVTVAPTGPAVFVLEVVALALFVAFWALQSGRVWASADPALTAPSPTDLSLTAQPRPERA